MGLRTAKSERTGENDEGGRKRGRPATRVGWRRGDDEAASYRRCGRGRKKGRLALFSWV